jgi:hypothetical protein
MPSMEALFQNLVRSVVDYTAATIETAQQAEA